MKQLGSFFLLKPNYALRIFWRVLPPSSTSERVHPRCCDHSYLDTTPRVKLCIVTPFYLMKTLNDAHAISMSCKCVCGA